MLSVLPDRIGILSYVAEDFMRYRPAPEEFAKLARGHSLVPVYRQLVGDTLTPVTAFRAIQDGDWSFLCESVIGGERLGPYRFLGSGPFLPFSAPPHSVPTQDPTPPTPLGRPPH